MLEASRSFHLPHAAMCGGRARCSTCRVRVTAGQEFCPPAANDELNTLRRVGAPPGVRLACQLRPRGDISIVPLVRTARPIYRQSAPQRSGEHEVVVLFCDIRNRANLAQDRLPQDLLHILTMCIEGVGNAIRTYGGTVSYAESDSICALFGHSARENSGARSALLAAGAIDGVIADLNNRLGSGDKVKITVSIHAGQAAIAEIGSSEPPTLLAVGEAIDVINDVRKVAAERDKPFAITAKVYDDAALDATFQEKVAIETATVLLSDAAPIPSPTWTLHGELGRRAMLRRLWAGG